MDNGETFYEADTTHERDPGAGEAPYLRIFGPNEGGREYDLPSTPVVIGRGKDVDVCCPHFSVSRQHARLVLKGKHHYIEDLGSRAGTCVNGKRVERLWLKHGDTITISQFILQYRTDDRWNDLRDPRAQETVDGQFSFLPSSMVLEYRYVFYPPERVFTSGDTLSLGSGGILMAVDHEPPDDICVEVALTFPNRKRLRFLGEIMGTVPGAARLLLCVKLHRVPPEMHRAIVRSAQSGSWASAPRE